MIQPLRDFYADFLNADLSDLDRLYAEDVVFTDPVIAIGSREELYRYFTSARKGLIHCQFHFENTIVEAEQASLTWSMHFAHVKLKQGALLRLRGASVMVFNGQGRCTKHTDFYDMGAMLYEHIPVLGGAVRWLKTQI